MGPTVADLQRIATDAGLGLDDSELAVCQQLIEYGAAPFAQLAATGAIAPAGERPPAQRPDPEEAPRGAWASRAEIAGAARGELAGKRMAIKDNIAVAGMPLTVGTTMLEGVVAASDATVVTRVLDAGATILGTATCEALTMSGGSHTSDTAVVGNPYDETRTPGGSSTGCAALLAAGAVEIALATDVAGSVRIPASWSGLSALKPTYGLVPYSGGFPASPSLDHIGPMARTVADVADLLGVIAGPDGRDPRQGAAAPLGQLGTALDGSVEGLRIGVLREGFGLPGLSEPEVDEAVTAASKAFAELGAAVSEVSVAEHGLAAQLWNVVAVTEGAEVFSSDSDGRWAGYYDPALVEVYAAARDRRANELPDTVKAMLLMGLYVRDSFGDGAHAIAQAQRPLIRHAYDRALVEVDLLLLPTTPQRATEIPAAEMPMPMRFMAGVEMTANTCPFNLTGHPALSVPCGMAGGLPIGLMLVGRHDEDATVLRAGDAYQRQVFSPPSP